MIRPVTLQHVFEQCCVSFCCGFNAVLVGRVHGGPARPLLISGVSWGLMGAPGTSWASWGLLGRPGAFCIFLGPSRSVQELQGLPGTFWCFLGLHWASLGLRGPPEFSGGCQGFLSPPEISWGLVGLPDTFELSWDLLGSPGASCGLTEVSGASRVFWGLITSIICNLGKKKRRKEFWDLIVGKCPCLCGCFVRQRAGRFRRCFTVLLSAFHASQLHKQVASPSREWSGWAGLGLAGLVVSLAGKSNDF